MVLLLTSRRERHRGMLQPKSLSHSSFPSSSLASQSSARSSSSSSLATSSLSSSAPFPSSDRHSSQAGFRDVSHQNCSECHAQQLFSARLDGTPVNSIENRSTRLRPNRNTRSNQNRDDKENSHHSSSMSSQNLKPTKVNTSSTLAQATCSFNRTTTTFASRNNNDNSSDNSSDNMMLRDILNSNLSHGSMPIIKLTTADILRWNGANSLRGTAKASVGATQHSKAFGWGDFPLLQESMVVLNDKDAIHDDAYVQPMPVSSSSSTMPVAAVHQHRPSFESLTTVPPSNSHSPHDTSAMHSIVECRDHMVVEESKVDCEGATVFPPSPQHQQQQQQHCTSILSSTQQRRRRRRSKSSQRHVTFDHVEIREYDITAGYHDWCDDDLALTLDWTYATPAKRMFVDDYENRKQRRHRNLQKMDYAQRKHRLRVVAGWTQDDIKEWHRAASSMRDQVPLHRSKTICHFSQRQ